MKKVRGFSTIALIMILSMFFFNCESGNKNDMIAKSKTELINTDTEFFNISQKNGTGQAFIDFADNNAIMLRQDSYPVTGKKEIMKLYQGREKKVTPLKWKPIKADVSNDGTMGFTYGNWEYGVKDKDGKMETVYGNYVTVWKKQPDGKWKFVLDGGNTTPPPVNNN